MVDDKKSTPLPSSPSPPPLHNTPKIRYSYCMNTKPFPLLLSLIFLLLFSGNSFIWGQEPKLIKKYWNNGNLRSEGKFIIGKPEGRHTEWYENGEKKSEEYYKNGKIEGLRREWTVDGKIMSE